MATFQDDRPTAAGQLPETAGARKPSDRTSARRALGGSLVGSTIEWYDFFIYGTAATLVFGPQFFPSGSGVASTLAAFASFAVGFIARPFGGIVMGHFGDRIGRKSMLVLSLGLMGTATVAIGLLPNYAAIGVWAPILLVALRFVQGFGVGGEWGGAVLMATEHAPKGKAGLYGVAPQLGVPAGVMIANLAFLAVSGLTSEGAFEQWGWRIPFLASGVLIAVALWIRLGVHESPTFENVRERGQVVRIPLFEVVRSHARSVFLAAGTFIASNAIGIVWLTFVLTYGSNELGIDRTTMLTVVVLSCPVWMAGQALGAYWSDFVARRVVYIRAALLLLVVSLVFFPLIDTGSLPLVVVAMLLMAFAVGVPAGPQSALFAELFPAHLRYSGASAAYQIGAILGGGIAPMIVTALYARYDSSWAITVYFVVVGLVSIASILMLRVDPASQQLRERRS